jgi:hypothetical protein
VSETEALKRPFLIGLLACAIAFVIVGGVIAVFAMHTDDRPEGIAERWLTAVGDLTRDGVHADAIERVRAHGDVGLAQFMVTGDNDYDGKTAFEALEVGKARVDGNTALVPVSLTYRGEDHESRGVLRLERDGDSWKVRELLAPDPTLKVPSDGGDVAAKAPAALYVGALVLGAGVAVGASALVRLAGREREHFEASVA